MKKKTILLCEYFYGTDILQISIHINSSNSNDP